MKSSDKCIPLTRARHVVLPVLLAVGLALGGCASAPEERGVQRGPAPAATTVRLPPTRVFFYPNAGQTPEQQDRDRYECYLWATKQTGFDPGQPLYAPHVRVEVIPLPPPGHDTAVGAVTGAVLGAAISRPGDAAGGAVVGAMAGAVIGAASDASRRDEAERMEERYARVDAQRLAQIERKAADYRRAMAACLEGRGYNVQ